MKTSARRAFRSSAHVEEKQKHKKVGFSCGHFQLTIPRRWQIAPASDKEW